MIQILYTINPSDVPEHTSCNTRIAVLLQIIRLSDCIRVSEAAEVDGCPKDCKAFLVETTEKTFVFAVEMVEVDDWMQKLCEIAFPVSKNSCSSIWC